MFFNEIIDALTPPFDIGKQPTNQDMEEIERCYPQIKALTNSGIVSTLKNQPHCYIVGNVRFQIVNGDTVILL